MKNEVCKTCRFWESTAPEGERSVDGWCHRLPPLALKSGRQFPVSFPHDWCGEWQRITDPEVDRHNERILAQARAL